MKALRVAQWEQAHETSESRKILNLPWYRKPNKHDGRGYRRMTAQKEPEALYGAWIAILDVVCKGPREFRGWLVREGKPLEAKDLAEMTGFRKSVFDRALAFFKKEPVCWLVEAEFPPARSGDSPGLPGLSAGAPGKSSGQRRGEESTGEDQGENKGRSPAEKAAAERALRTQFAALNAQVTELEKRSDDLNLDELQELRKKRAALKQVTDRQAKGEF